MKLTTLVLQGLFIFALDIVLEEGISQPYINFLISLFLHHRRNLHSLVKVLFQLCQTLQTSNLTFVFTI